MPEAGAQPAKHERSLVGFYVAMGLLAMLVGLGAMLYRPLRLAYVVHRVRTSHDAGGDHFSEYIDDVDECTRAACQGNRLAMEAVIDASGVGDGAVAETTCEIAYRVVAEQPQAFFGVLSLRPTARQLEVLGDIAAACVTEDEYESGGFMGVDPGWPVLARELEFGLKSQDPEVSRVAAAALDFARRRFAKELAEAEKVKAEVPKP